MPHPYPAPLNNLMEESLRFAQGYLGASGALFFWLDPSRNAMQVQHAIGIPAGLLDQYELGMYRFDPMEASLMVRSGKKVGFLEEGYAEPLGTDMERYKAYLNSFGVASTIDLMFWSQGRAFGGIGLLKTTTDLTVTAPTDRVRELHGFLEVSLGQHPHVRRLLVDALLEQRGLSHRERQVVRLVETGASNREIAQEMGITVGTVKTYLVRIFEKLDIKSRAALATYSAKR